IMGVQLHIPEDILNACANSIFLLGATSARKLLRPRKSGANKTSFGHLLVVAGSDGMEGAALLTSEAAARMGCGYVTLCSSSENIFLKAKPDFLKLSMDDFFKSDLQKYDAVVIGPGMGISELSEQMLLHVQKNHEKVLVDADALTLLAKRSKLALPADWVLTPHAGELARLLESPAKELENDRLASVERAAREINAHILFKGFRTVLGKKGRSWIIGSGNVALAKAGSGDVLAGFIGSLMAQGHSTKEAGILGAYLHGHIADEWLRLGHSTRTLMASDLADRIDASLWSLKKART
ncbi:MAG: NAD(P)H-hydrate dehydratase, partial [Proteobacteria bacterium]